MSKSARRRRDDGDDPDEAPVRPYRPRRHGSSPVLVAAIVLGALVLFVGVVVGIYLAAGKPSAGAPAGAPAEGGQPFTITEATRSVDPKNGKQVLAVSIESVNVASPAGGYSLKARAGGQTSTYDGAFKIFPGMAGKIFFYTAEYGPTEVWVESTGGDGKPGVRVSNTYLIR